jgi:radical SAM protein with 4Fe4S-binding SPASM domain
MNVMENSEDWLCRQKCHYYKPHRKEPERCRGYNIVSILAKSRPQLLIDIDAGAFDSGFRSHFLRKYICRSCPFYIQDCDFTSEEPPENCVPCGGLVFLSNVMKHGIISEEDIRLADMKDLGEAAFVSLASDTWIKMLEEDYLYKISTDELYEINRDAQNFLTNCDGSKTVGELHPDNEFLEFCISEGLLEVAGTPVKRIVEVEKSPEPSLRYLEWLVTYRCNLSCAHCYLGDTGAEDFPPELIAPLLAEFSEMQGLRIMISGGEPTLYQYFKELNDALPRFPVRAVLLTNGSTLHRSIVENLNFQEVQISLDGMEFGHEMIRGRGSFRKAVKAMELVRDSGIDLSVATMVHKHNLDEWEAMKELIESIGAREWNVDYPCVRGRWKTHPELQVGIEEAAERMKFSFGGSYHGGSSGWACGRHLAAVLPSGEVCKCGLFPEIILGSVRTGLRKAWLRMEHIRISETDCRSCQFSDACGGGCRFRAGSKSACDEVMCLLYKGTTSGAKPLK